MLRHTEMKTNFTVTIITILMLSISCCISEADEYVSFLFIRYPNQMVETFLQGPYSSKERCDSLNQTTLDNIITSCGSCEVDDKFCIRINDMREFYSKALRKEKTAYPYVIATPKGRIIISGIPTESAFEVCKALAKKFRSNGYDESRCVLP